jgi:hypothetical protein
VQNIQGLEWHMTWITSRWRSHSKTTTIKSTLRNVHSTSVETFFSETLIQTFKTGMWEQIIQHTMYWDTHWSNGQKSSPLTEWTACQYTLDHLTQFNLTEQTFSYKFCHTHLVKKIHESVIVGNIRYAIITHFLCYISAPKDDHYTNKTSVLGCPWLGLNSRPLNLFFPITIRRTSFLTTEFFSLQ